MRFQFGNYRSFYVMSAHGRCRISESNMIKITRGQTPKKSGTKFEKIPFKNSEKNSKKIPDPKKSGKIPDRKKIWDL